MNKDIVLDEYKRVVKKINPVVTYAILTQKIIENDRVVDNINWDRLEQALLIINNELENLQNMFRAWYLLMSADEEEHTITKGDDVIWLKS